MLSFVEPEQSAEQLMDRRRVDVAACRPEFLDQFISLEREVLIIEIGAAIDVCEFNVIAEIACRSPPFIENSERGVPFW